MSKRGTYASPPCKAEDVDPTYFDPLGTDSEQAREVARWRRAERTRLAGLWEGLGQTAQAQASASICGHLATIRAARADTGLSNRFYHSAAGYRRIAIATPA